MKNEVKVIPTGDHVTVTVREGHAPVIDTSRQGAQFDGDINAPWEFFATKFRQVQHDGRKRWHDGLPFFDLTDMLVCVSLKSGSITWHENVHSAVKSCVIKGRIIENPALAALKINTGTKYSALALADLLRMNRLLFITRDANFEAVKRIEEFRAIFETEAAQWDDKKGNKGGTFVQNMRNKLDISFTLCCPILVGGLPVSFSVEVNCDVRDRAVEFWLESIEMHEYLQDTIEKAIQEQVDKFTKAGVTVITTG